MSKLEGQWGRWRNGEGIWETSRPGGSQGLKVKLGFGPAGTGEWGQVQMVVRLLGGVAMAAWNMDCMGVQRRDLLTGYCNSPGKGG